MEIYSTLWLILQWIIFIMMIGPLPFFFYSQYKKDKAEENKGGMAFNLGYTLFFIFTSLNQLVYIIDAVGVYSTAIGWDPILNASIKNTLLFEYTIKSQIIVMFFLFFGSFLPIIYPVEKYIQRWENYPVTKIIFIATVGSGLSWLLFCVFRLPQPIELIPFQIIVLILMAISVFGFLISLFAFVYFYMKLAINSTGIVRKKALVVTFGIFFLYIALIGGNVTRPIFWGTPLELIGPICLILGMIILIYGFKIKII